MLMIDRLGASGSRQFGRLICDLSTTARTAEVMVAIVTDKSFATETTSTCRFCTMMDWISANQIPKDTGYELYFACERWEVPYHESSK